MTFLSLGLVFIASCASLETKELNTKVDKIQLFNETAFSYQDLKDIGMSHFEVGDYDKAISYLSECMIIDGSDLQVQEWLSMAYFNNNQKTLSLKLIENLENRTSINSSLNLLKAKIYEELYLYDKALAQYKEAYLKKIDNSTLWSIYKLQLILKLNIEALTTLEDLQENEADYISVLRARADLFLHMNRSSDAIFIYKNILSLSPMDKESLKKLMSLSVEQEDWKSLHQYAERYLMYYTYDRDTVLNLVKSYEFRKMYAEAQLELEKYKKYDVSLEAKITEIRRLQNEELEFNRKMASE